MKAETLLAEGAAALDFPLTQEQLGRLTLYCAELGKWMRRINLVARDTSTEQLVELHFLDSLVLAPMLANHPATHLLDIGSGAGFPGLVLAALFPEARFSLVEPRQKRAIFLRHVVRLLALARVEVVEARVETLYHNSSSRSPQTSYSHITGRAVAEPAAFLEMAAPLAAADTDVVLFLARSEGLDDLPEEVATHWRLHAERQCVLPFSRAPRFLACMRRCAGPEIQS